LGSIFPNIEPKLDKSGIPPIPPNPPNPPKNGFGLFPALLLVLLFVFGFVFVF
jgi:hypothetical protein